MTVIHCLAAYSRGNVTGLQSTQRDWSPYLTHFTTWSAMNDVRSAIKQAKSPTDIAQLLAAADSVSWSTMQKIIESGRLLARSPSQKDQLPPCVCLSECTLPGLISHCERYGRFGLVFQKEHVFREGGRPCLYVAEEEYTCLASIGRGKSIDTPEGRLFALANVYVPPRGKNKVQDYTHEREWRIFCDLDIRRVKAVMMLSPTRYVGALGTLVPRVAIVPIDTLFDWGA